MISGEQKTTIRSENAKKDGVGKQMPLDALVAEIDREVTPLSGSSAAAASTAAASDGQKTTQDWQEQYIRFLLNDILLAIPLSRALEIGHEPRITPLPNLPEWVLGVSNIRGEIVSIVDLKAFFGLPVRRHQRQRRLIVVSGRDMKVGLIVDNIMGSFYLTNLSEEIQGSPYEEGDMEMKLAAYITGVIPGDEKLLNMLDVNRLLSSHRMNAFNAE